MHEKWGAALLSFRPLFAVFVMSAVCPALRCRRCCLLHLLMERLQGMLSPCDALPM